jgi:hypothetical protein
MGIEGIGHLRDDPEYFGADEFPGNYDPLREEGETYTGVIKKDEENELEPTEE